MKLLYIGNLNPSSTSNHRLKSIERLNHQVIGLDPYINLQFKRFANLLGHFHYRTGYKFLQKKIHNWLTENSNSFTDVQAVWINGGELLGKRTMDVLDKLECPIILYNNDDPTGERDGRRFDTLLTSLPSYTLCTVLRNINLEEYKSRGAKNVIRVLMSYDEILHRPYSSINEIPSEFRSEVAFIGTWMRYEKRDEFLLKLIQLGVPVSIWGGRWNKSPFWDQLKSFYRGPALSGKDYVAAIQGAKICLGLLSKGNRDLHTRRSVEVPYAGGLLCAERTSEHMELYKEGEEAVFWSDALECATVCNKLLADNQLRESIRLNGMNRVRELKVGNEDICKKILDEVIKIKII